MYSVQYISYRMILPRGISELKRCVASSLGITFPPESYDGTSMSAMPPTIDAGDDMVCDPSIPLPTVNVGITKTQENIVNNNSIFSPSDKDVSLSGASCSNEFLNKLDILQTDFTHYASFLLSMCAGGDPESNIPDNVKFCVSTLVKFLQQQLEKITEAAFLELKKAKEAHDEEIAQLLNEFNKEMNEVQIISEGKIRELLNRHLGEVSMVCSPTQCQLRGVQNNCQLGMLHCKRKAQKMQVQLDEKVTDISMMNMSQEVKIKDTIATKVEHLQKKRHQSQEAAKASDQEVQQLKVSIEERDKAERELKSETSQLKSKCQKVEAQLAHIEQKAAQESLTSGSYADDHADPSMSEDACKSLDKATDNLIRILHGSSITGNRSAKLQNDLEDFLGEISSATLANFSRPVQVKYAWGHWICGRMTFQGFEHVFFNVDDGSMPSPLVPKIHAWNASKPSSRRNICLLLSCSKNVKCFKHFVSRSIHMCFL